MLEKQLESIGLNEKESKVYLALLELGQATAQEVATKANLNRATTYFIIDSLMKKGLAASFEQGKKQMFVGSDPEKLKDVLKIQEAEVKRREKELEEILPELKSVNNQIKGKPVVKYYEGKEGVKTMVSEVFDKPGETIYMAYSLDNIDEYFSEEESAAWVKIRREKNIKVKSIYSSTLTTLDSDPDTERLKIPQDKLPITCDIAVYGNKIRLASLSKRLIGVVIDDEELASSFRTIMKLAIEAAEKYKE